MRIWSLHPKYLDPQGLIALWREALLAQAVLRGETRGYRNHPQLERFKKHSTPLSAISYYLLGVHAEAEQRGYTFDKSKIRSSSKSESLTVTSGQVAYEWKHLLCKLKDRSPALYRKWLSTKTPDVHPMFTLLEGEIESWERQ